MDQHMVTHPWFTFVCFSSLSCCSLPDYMIYDIFFTNNLTCVLTSHCPSTLYCDNIRANLADLLLSRNTFLNTRGHVVKLNPPPLSDPHFSAFCSLAFGTLYPAYSSYKAVKTKNVKEYVSITSGYKITAECF